MREFHREERKEEQRKRGHDLAGQRTLRRDTREKKEDGKKREAIARHADDIGGAVNEEPVQRHPDRVGRAQPPPAPDGAEK